MKRLEVNMANEEQTNIEKYEFEPIKGYPMLNWKGKRPFRSTQYFPAQLKEVYGHEDENGWINKIFWGDNLQVMSHLLKNFRGRVDLIYIDPPFDSKANYGKKIKLKNKSGINGDQNSFEEKQYTDLWSNDEYLQFMYERLILLKELLSDTGLIYLHCDYHKSHHLRCILDEVFGQENFINECIWKRTTAHGDSKQGAKRYDIVHDNILLYSKTSSFKWNTQFVPFSDDQIAQQYNKEDENGRKYRLVTPTASKPGGDTSYEYRGVTPPPGRFWAYKKETMRKFEEEGKLYFSSTGQPYIKYFLDERPGVAASTLWSEIPILSPTAKERLHYPTQKPEALIERIIKTATDEGDLVLDVFMGSGTTQAVSSRLKRKFIGSDINLGAVQTTTKRLALREADFEVYNVNNYEIFRNPLEAKSLLIEALEVQLIDGNIIYDGEKEGYKVKIMPVNRIATKEDLNELVANFPYKKFEERKAANANKPVENIMLICMGHEPGLGAALENECGYKLKIEVVDILRDKSDLIFKYDSEAIIKIKDGKLVIDEFYPRNLLQKLSQQKEDINEWREMVESIMIDWNYDGAVMEPVVIDIPDKNEFVVGEYKIPEGASNIKIKITDLLSESYEEVIAHG
ncbi:site-specific DNA-methyltransferase [Pantoea endophytica]|uniref:site-specific DNA-methyltransferase (adenine-specific) n=2 Tax=Pantoea endophytica TaxID=92488 RepID=A0ABX4SJM1_9GAMM|nr:site-specific DNA-methyltransferase [Pantoea endophytica]